MTSCEIIRVTQCSPVPARIFRTVLGPILVKKPNLWCAVRKREDKENYSELNNSSSSSL
jgi:hypothetical protein